MESERAFSSTKLEKNKTN